MAPTDPIYQALVHIYPYHHNTLDMDYCPGQDLTGYDLRGSILRDYSFNNSILDYASFEGADLTGVKFIGAKLREVNFKNAKMDGAVIIGADITDANFSGARGRIRGGSDILPEQQIERVGPTINDLSLFVPGADLRNANLQGADLSGLDLRGANLSDANFTKAKLFQCNLEGAILRRATFWNTKIAACDFRRADLRGAFFYQASVNWLIAGATARGASFLECIISAEESTLDRSTDFSHIFCQDWRYAPVLRSVKVNTDRQRQKMTSSITPESPPVIF